MKTNTCFLIVIMVVMTAAMLYAWTFPYWQAKLAPLTVSVVVVIIAAGILIKDIGTLKAAQPKEEPDAAHKSETRKTVVLYFVEGAWMVGFVVAMYLFGLLVAIPIYGVAYMRSHGAPWAVAILLAALTGIFVSIVFIYFLDLTLYPGLVYIQMTK